MDERGTSTPTVRADDIPVAHTPPGGWHGTFPAPVLTACTEPLAPGAPDLRGLWQVTDVEVNGERVAEHPAYRHLERVEQCGDRVVITAGGIIHDMRADGTLEHAVHDVAEFDKTTEITVVASFEDGVLVLRPEGLPVEVRRRRDGDALVWDYLGFTARLARIGEPDATPPSS